MKLSRRALIVEDDLTLWQDRLKTLYPSPDWELVFAKSAEDAEAKFKADTDWDMLVVDYKLEGERTGHDFLTFARNIDTNVPIILFTDKEKSFGPRDQRKSQIHFDKDEFLKDERDKSPRHEFDRVQTQYYAYMADRCSPHIHSEFAKLETVLVHTPDQEVERIDNLVSMPDVYLVDSLPKLRKSQDEHRGFIRAIKEHAHRPLVLDVGLLLYDVLKDLSGDDLKRVVESILLPPELVELLGRFRSGGLEFSDLLARKLEKLCNLDRRDLTRFLFCGLNLTDFEATAQDEKRSQYQAQLVLPIVNAYFTRDPSFVLAGRFFLGKMFRPIRRREPAILRAVLGRHPFFAKANERLFDLGKQDSVLSAEGGDAMAIKKGVFAIGISERTSQDAAERVVAELFREPETETVYLPLLTRARAFIHLDTVCSLVGPNVVAVYKEAINAQMTTIRCCRAATETGFRRELLDRSFVDILDDMGKKVVHVSKQDHWDDGANVFMVDPQTALAYSRNEDINKALRDQGINVVEFHGDDLVLGRGGPRCMTMPVRRGD